MIQSPTHAYAFWLPVIRYQVQYSTSEHFGAGQSSRKCNKKKNKPQRERTILYSVPEADLNVDCFGEGTLQDDVEVLKSLQHSDQRIHHHVIP